jgi:CRISPR-associated endonuclease/helicase Cas3
LLHDLGKYQSAFQDYLINGGRRGSVPHASWGAGYARIHKLLEASIVIDGHHKGLPDNAAWKSDTIPYMHNEIQGFKDVVLSFLDDVGVSAADVNPSGAITFSESSQREIFIRYLFSALTDSDWLSTEEHFEAEKAAMRVGCALPVDEMIIKLEEEFSRKSKEGEINQLRNAARNEVIQKAPLPTGFYSLALPTGMGKTLISLAWALRHAKQNGLKRIIIVLPFINIIDQTAQILKGIFGEEIILEHHSSYNEGEKSNDDEKEALPSLQKRKQLACENWDYPVVVTTTVQFFESLFSNKPSKCRKNHNIAEAVVIFDEVQSLPKEVILPTLQMLKDIQVVMKASFLFCTATQPAFEKRPKFDGITAICPLVEGPGALYDKTRRVEYHLLDNLALIDYDRLSEVVMDCDASTLVIFNTKKAALEFYTFMGSIGNWDRKYHLSTSMCPFHRKGAIKRIRDDLYAKQKILVVSTQLIEAGVDFDFPVLFRAMAPLEAVIQSAGRCNREKGLAGYGNVFLFKLQDAGMPDKTYASCAGFAEELIKADINQLYSHDAFERYYSQVIDLYVEPDKYGINESRRKYNFETVNDSYRIIQKATEGLFIYNFNEDSRQLLHSLRYKEFLGRNDYRKMQDYTVQVYENFIFQNADLIETMPQGLRVWHGKYDQATGISVAPMEADNYVV